MADRACILVLGLDELASAVARLLLLSGHAVAMHDFTPPDVLHRKMAFSDAWYDGAAALDGVEAFYVTRDADLLAGLRGGMFIPVLTETARETVGRWPWDAIVDARAPATPENRASLDAELIVALGPGAVAGADCDLVIETGGADPGAIVRNGPARTELARNSVENPVVATAAGQFQTQAMIGDQVAAGDILGFAGALPVLAPCGGRLSGLRRAGQKVRPGDIVADISSSVTAQTGGVARTHQMIARSVAFAIEMEQSGARLIWNGHDGFDGL